MLSLKGVEYLALASAWRNRDLAEALHEGVIEGFVERHCASLDQIETSGGAREKRETSDQYVDGSGRAE